MHGRRRNGPLAFVVALVVTLPGCAGQQDRLVESSGGRPGWIGDDRDAFEEGDRRFYRAVVDRQKSLDLATDRARFAAIGRIADEVNLKVVAEFGESTNVGSNDIDNPGSGSRGSEILRTIAAASKATLAGVTPERSYWEKWQLAPRDEESAVAYKAYSLVSIAKKDLVKARIAATEAGVREAQRIRNVEAKARLEKALEALKQDSGN